MDNIKETSPIIADGQEFGPLIEPANSFRFQPMPCESIVAEGANNSYIVLGRDRMGEEGYGKTKSGRCGSIDLVAGRMSTSNAETIRMTGGRVSPSPVSDAARLYLSQKSDIDVLFYCPTGKSGISKKGNSAAVLKADDVRIIARDTLKIIVGSDLNLSKLGQNNSPVPVSEFNGVELIAEARAYKQGDLQPIPKGDNLKDFLYNLIDRLKNTNAILADFMDLQSRINNYVVNHKHVSSYPGTVCTPSPELIIDMLRENNQMYARIETGIKKCNVNIASTIGKYLSSASKNYINSKYHHLN